MIERIKYLFSPEETPAPGMYHYQAPGDDPRNYRLHLRIEPDGNGLLLVNASTVLHLNRTAAEYAYYMVRNLPVEDAGSRMSRNYRVPQAEARRDYQEFTEKIQTLVNTPDLDPETFLDFDRRAPFSRDITAPYRLDCALTYRLPAQTSAEMAPVERVKQELSTVEWKSILDKTWAAGIPQVIFTGGEPTLREDLVELLGHAEKNGQVTGLLTDGIRLADETYRASLLQTGLDHVLILLDPGNPLSWEAVQEALVEDLSVAVHLTLETENKDGFSDVLRRLSSSGVQRVSLSTIEPALGAALEEARNQAAFLGLELVWNLPVPYSEFNPIALETSSRQKYQPAGRAWMYVEPDGDVLREQGAQPVLGNLLNDPWEKIWKAV